MRVAPVAFALLLALPAFAVAASAPASPPACDVAVRGYVPTPEVSAGPCPGIRPGSALILRVGPYWFAPVTQAYVSCTMGFLLTDGTDLYVTTAGHCVANADGSPNIGGRVAAHGVPGTFGSIAWQWCEGRVANAPCSPGRDFGLIRVDADKRAFASPAMCGWGAPEGGLARPTSADGSGNALAQHFGWGTGVAAPTVGVESAGEREEVPLGIQPANPATQAREGPVLGVAAATVTIGSAALPGDSGSGVMMIGKPGLDGSAPLPQALGTLTHTSGATATVQRLDASLARLKAETGLQLALAASA